MSSQICVEGEHLLPITKKLYCGILQLHLSIQTTALNTFVYKEGVCSTLWKILYELSAPI